MPFVNLPTGINMYYEVEGSGDPLILIMGTAADHNTWTAQVQAYKSDYTVITYDARGTGQSTHPESVEDYSMRILAEDAAALLDHLDISTAHVSGLSLGSATAQELAINHPKKVSTLQLHGTWGRSDEWFIRMIDTNEYPVLNDNFELYIRTALLWVSSPDFINNQPELVATFEKSIVLDNPYPPSKNGMLGHFHADKTHDALDRLPNINVPTLITSGEMDWQVPTRYGMEVHNSIKNSEIHIFDGPNSSHIAFYEMAEVWNKETLDWLKKQKAL